jgi:Ser/Thr protein kinase RdoA (MazF antagonist)
VLKVANTREKREVLEAQNAMMEHLARHDIDFCPRVVPALSGAQIVTVESHLVRVLTYLRGQPLASVEVQSAELLYDFGRKLGRLAAVLVGFEHPAAHRDLYWDLARGIQVVDEFGPQIHTDWLRELVVNHRRDLCLSVADLRKSVIHGDANDYNVLVDPERMIVTGLLDFGDMVYSYTVGELAIAIAYVVLDKPDPRAAADQVIEGYASEFRLFEEELEMLWPLVRLRLAMSVCIAASQLREQPENEYLRVSQKSIEASLPRLI